MPLFFEMGKFFVLTQGNALVIEYNKSVPTFLNKRIYGVTERKRGHQPELAKVNRLMAEKNKSQKA